jgi:hypothetical protein
MHDECMCIAVELPTGHASRHIATGFNPIHSHYLLYDTAQNIGV